MVIVEPIKPPETLDPKEIVKWYRAVCQRFSYLSDTGNPVTSSILPRWPGDYYYESTAGDWWRSTGITAASWEQITFAAGSVGDHGTLVGLTDDDHTQYIKHVLATAANDFLVASGSGVFIKKTLAETKAILGININKKIVEIGDWNMDSTASKDVAHGVTLSKIRTVNAMIRNDADDTYYPVENSYNNATFVASCYIYEIDATSIKMSRYATSTFDSANFDSTSYNRGWITIEYID